MSPLKDHIGLVAGFLQGQEPPQALDALMQQGELAGPRGLVYRNSSLLACVEALKSNFQATQLIMGDDFFAGVARLYTETHRPTSRSLVGFGKNFSNFLSETEDKHGFAWLPDLARLDYAWLEAHLAQEAQAFTPEEFAELAQDETRLMESVFAVTPSAQLVQTSWSVHSLWSTLKAGQTPTEKLALDAAPETVLFLRPAGEVFSLTLADAEQSFLSALMQGQALGRAAESALAREPEADVGAILTKFIQLGLFVTQAERGCS